MQPTTPLPFTVPLGRRAHKLAERFFVQHTKQKGRQVYFNTLAVHAVEFYLKCMSIETDWEASNSYDPVMQMLLDTADIEVKDCGKLECRPLLAGAEAFQVPSEVWSDRIGYVAVEINKSMVSATLLGFVESVSTEEVPISQLRSLKELRMHLYHLSQPRPVLRSIEELGVHLRQTNQLKIIRTRANLSLWLQNVFEPSWRSLEEVFGTEEQNSVVRFRSVSQLNTASVKRARLINLGMELKGQAVVLIIIVTKEPEQEAVSIRVQLHPVSGSNYLNPNIKLVLLSAGEIFDNAESRSWGLDNFIQLSLEGLPSECFEIQVTLGETSVTESFVI